MTELQPARGIRGGGQGSAPKTEQLMTEPQPLISATGIHTAHRSLCPHPCWSPRRLSCSRLGQSTVLHNNLCVLPCVCAKLAPPAAFRGHRTSGPCCVLLLCCFHHHWRMLLRCPVTACTTVLERCSPAQEPVGCTGARSLQCSRLQSATATGPVLQVPPQRVMLTVL
jgi:hypothetical protein